MGDDKPGGGPTQKVRLSNGFRLMKCLVTNAQYARYLNKLKESNPKRASLDPVESCPMSDIVLENGYYRALQGRDNYPVVGATWKAAHDYAEYYELRLPTEAEWEWAARGPESRIYPWGDCWDASRCCCKENQGRRWHWERKQYVKEGDSWDETEVTYTSPVGSFPDGASWCEALDMAGNLMEWCQDWYAEYPNSEGTVQDPQGPIEGDGRVVRGGNWFYGKEECRTTDRTHHPPPCYSNDSDGFRCVYTSKPESANRHRLTSREDSPEYQVALSCAGEDRAYVRAVAEFLERNHISFFYDEFEEARPWGKDLYEYFDAIFRQASRYCVMFISEHYARKVWPTHERRSAFARALEQKDEYVLPARFDDTQIPGLPPTVGYIDLRKKTAEELGELILKKLG